VGPPIKEGKGIADPEFQKEPSDSVEAAKKSVGWEKCTVGDSNKRGQTGGVLECHFSRKTTL